ncbi:TIGR03643 family protein [Rhodoferax lacus]|nr:TIGR03643 family protein [Rhodoferax lacus]
MEAKFSQRLASLSEGDLSAIIQMAWEDRTAFETIQERTGWSEADVIRLMRHALQPRSFRMWRKRMKGRTTKHRAMRSPNMKFDDRLVANHRRANC